MAKGRRDRRQVLTELVQKQDQQGLAALASVQGSDEFRQDEQALLSAVREVETLVTNQASLDEVQRSTAHAAWSLRAFANRHAVVLAQDPRWPTVLAGTEDIIEKVIRLSPGTADGVGNE